MAILKKVFHNLKATRDLLLLRTSGLFDKDWYLKNNPDVEQAKVSPLVHYYRHGGLEGRDPGPKFSSSWYLDTYADVRTAGINPLLHYLKNCRPEGRKQHNKEVTIKSILYRPGNEPSFSIPDQAIRAQFRPELKNWNGYQELIVLKDEKLWIVKNYQDPEMVKRELLVYFLARGLVNAAEVKSLSLEDCHELVKLDLLPQNASPYNTLIVRLAQGYSIDELPQKNFDSAMASEFVFSLWVRRRDPDHYNRAYTKEGIPVFFDLNCSLNDEYNLKSGMPDIDKFFANHNYGLAGSWRVRERGNIPLINSFLREDPYEYGYDFFDNIEDFKDAIDVTAERIIAQKHDLRDLVKKAGYSGEEIEALTTFIATTKKTLSDDVKKMLKVIFSEPPFNTQHSGMHKRMNASNRNWLNSINEQIGFYQKSNRKIRTDLNFPWSLVDNEIKLSRQLLDRNTEQVLWWINCNAERLWESRSLLNDELSKIIFDSTLVLRSTGFQKFFFPRINFDDIIEIVDENPFSYSGLPEHILGIPLNIFDIRWIGLPHAIPIKIICCREDLFLLNRYRQYLIRRNSFDIFLSPGDIVLDCGACIGDVSLIFAGLVGIRGEVHTFDPVPLHGRYCRLQASLNPSLAHVFHVNDLAVGDRMCVKSGDKSDSDIIEPSGLAINQYTSTSLDEYANSKLSRVDFIKMDIEGAEMDAIDGASKIIREFKPRLAISVYHKPDDLWEIPIKLKSINPGYELYFGHHSPVLWESVIYAVQR